MDKITHEMRLAQWSSIIRECNNSGMAKKSWMAINNINEKQFYYWQRRIRCEAIQDLEQNPSSSPTFAELPASVITCQQVDQPDAVLRIGKCTLEIHNSFTPVLLQSILQVIANA